MHTTCKFSFILLLLVIPKFCLAWTGAGHQLIAVMAYDQLNEQAQSQLVSRLKLHPHIDRKLSVPNGVTDPDRWLVGRAATWPDLIRGTKFDRPNWHWEERASVVIGTGLELPKPKLFISPASSLQNESMHLIEAITLCRSVIKDVRGRDPRTDDEERAIALSWILHLVGDAHQPCHAGSLYSSGFPKGDRGANEIRTKQRQKLHAVWDGLLGANGDLGDIDRRARDLMNDAVLVTAAKMASSDPTNKWVDESADLAKDAVYTPAVLEWVKRVDSGDNPEPLVLSETHMKEAGTIARRRAALAAYRLAEILK